MNKFILEYGSIVNNEAPMNPFRNLSSEISLISVREFPQAQFRAVTKAIFLYLPLFWPGWGPSTGSTVNGCALFVSELLARLEIQSVEDNRKNSAADESNLASSTVIAAEEELLLLLTRSIVTHSRYGADGGGGGWGVEEILERNRFTHNSKQRLSIQTFLQRKVFVKQTPGNPRF